MQPGEKSICKAGSARRALAKPPPYSQRPWEMVTNTIDTKSHTYWYFTAAKAWERQQRIFCD